MLKKIEERNRVGMEEFANSASDNDLGHYCLRTYLPTNTQNKKKGS